MIFLSIFLFFFRNSFYNISDTNKKDLYKININTVFLTNQIIIFNSVIFQFFFFLASSERIYFYCETIYY